MFQRSPSTTSPSEVSSGVVQTDVVSICRDIGSSIISMERNVAVAKSIIYKLYRNPQLDLCAILPPIGPQNYQESPYYQMNALIKSSSFFETILDDDQLSADLWDGILQNCDISMAPTEPAKDSILFATVSQFVCRMLPCDDSPGAASLSVTHSPKTTQQHTIRTPLQVFRASSPLVNRISIEDRSQMMSTSNVSFQPRLVQNFCTFLAKACTTAQFTNTNKLLLIRYLLKQFHVFCQFNTGDAEVDAWKLDLMACAPFKWSLFDFFKSCITQVPTATVFRDITNCWLTYCRPWRYHNLSNPSDFAAASKYTQFVEKNVEFYEVILGKILKRFAAFEMCEELLAPQRAVVEFAWKEPQAQLLRHVQLDIHAHVRELLQHMQVVVSMHRAAISKEQAENAGFWNSLFSSGESAKTTSSRRLVTELLALMKDSDTYIGTRLLLEMSDEETVATTTTGNSSNSSHLGDRACTSLLNETPKSGLGVPDHYVDALSNHMLLSPIGRRQVLNRERRFDYSKCTKDDGRAPVRSYELGIAVKIATCLAQKANEIPLVQYVGNQYSARNVTGAIARRLMYPPVPNLDPNATVPAFSARIVRAPPLLRLRVFASFQSIFVLIWLLLTLKYGALFFFVSSILVAIFLIVAYALEMDTKQEYY